MATRTATGAATASNHRRDPPSLNEYWSTFPHTKGSNGHVAAAEEDGDAAPSTDTVATTHGTSISQPRSVEGTTPFSPNNSKNSGRPLVLHSGEAIDAKNTLRSNSMLRATPSNETTGRSNLPLNSDANEGNEDATRDVFANACLLDEEDGVVSIPPILIASASTNPLPLKQSLRLTDDASVSRLQVPKKWIPCLLVSILIIFGAGAAAGICGAGLCSRSTESATSTDRTTDSENDNAPMSGRANATSTAARTNSPTSAVPGTSAPTGPFPPPEQPGEMALPTPVPVTPMPNLPDPAEEQSTGQPTPAPAPNKEQRAADIVVFINSIALSGQSLSYPVDPNSMPSTEALALQWIIETDPLQLVPNTPANQFRLRQRYALRSLWVQQDEERRGALAWDQYEECNWSGIECTTTDVQDIGTVPAATTIDIVTSNLAGSIPNDFGLLWTLEKVDFWNNQIGGTLPAALGGLASLWYLSVQANFLTGTLPSEIGQWTNLRYFYMAENAMTGSIPSSISNWAFIEEARFDSNEFTGAVPDGVCTAVIDCDCDLMSCSLDVECTCCNVCNNQFGVDIGTGEFSFVFV